MTRADFYVGRGLKARWVGSIAFDGYPGERTREVMLSESARDFRSNVRRLRKDDGGDYTDQSMGWPWPWRDSSRTDYAYAWDRGRVYVCCFGGPWFAVTQAIVNGAFPSDAEFPEMDTSSAAPVGSDRSGSLVLEVGRR